MADSAYVFGFALVLTWLVAEHVVHRERIGALPAEVRRGHAAEIELVLADDRTRSAREMHDGLGHRLSVMSMALQFAERMRERDPDRAREQVSAARTQAGEALTTMRRWVRALSPVRVEGGSLAHALDSVAEGLRETGLEVTVDAPHDGLHDQAACLFVHRFVQEGLTNVLRHSGATRVDVGCTTVGGSLVLSIRDDGSPGAESRGAGQRVRAPVAVRARRGPRREPEHGMDGRGFCAGRGAPGEPDEQRPAGGVIGVLLVDDHRLLRDGVKMLLETVDGITVIAEAGPGGEALAMVERHAPDVVLTDARMPGMDGIELVGACRERWPLLPVLVLTTFDDDDVVHGALDAGAAGFLLKDVSPETLAEAITAVVRGEMVIDPRVARTALRPPARASADPLAALTRTERVVATHLSAGRTNREIADAMVIAEGTVKNHVSTVVRRLGRRDRTATALLVRDAVDRPG